MTIGPRRAGADSLGEREDLELARFAFGPTNIGFWTVSIELKLGEPHHAIEAAEQVAPGPDPAANQQAPYRAEVATAPWPR